MKPIFSRAGYAALDEYTQAKTLYAFDFDGTVAPIVNDPDDAFTLPQLRPLLRRLARKAKLAVISGRAVRDVGPRLYFPNHFVVGNHGLEGIREFSAKGERAKTVCRKWTAQIRRDLAHLPVGHGIYIEDKRHSLSLHFRHAKNPKRAATWLAEEIDNLHPVPRVIGGKFIYNIVPKGSPHKGTALKALMRRFKCTHAVFVGDDVTDEDAFGEKGRILSIRVGNKKDSLARFYVRGQNDLDELLNQILRRLK